LAAVGASDEGGATRTFHFTQHYPTPFVVGTTDASTVRFCPPDSGTTIPCPAARDDRTAARVDMAATTGVSLITLSINSFAPSTSVGDDTDAIATVAPFPYPAP